MNHITTIGINRPDKRNCVNYQTISLLRKALEEFEQDSNSYAAVLYGTGGNFCSGFDLQELVNLENNPDVYKSLENGLMVSRSF